MQPLVMEEAELIDSDKELGENQSSGEELELENRLHKSYTSVPEESNTQIPNHGELPFRKEDYVEFSGRRAADSTIEALGLSPVPDKLSSYKFQDSVTATKARDCNYNPLECGFLELQEANNISKAAFKEVMAMALEAKTWIVGTPALGSIEELQQMFRSPAPPGMRVESSIETAILPLAPKNLVSLLIDVDSWASTFSDIVHSGSSHSPTGVFSQLACDDQPIEKVVMVNAEFQVPSVFVPTLELSFLRYLRQIIPGIWAIVDVSDDYYDHKASNSSLEAKCRRRLSGVIIRSHGDYSSEVIWIENVEVYKHQVRGNIHFNLNDAFCAQRWVRTLWHKLIRSNSRFFTLKMPVGCQADVCLLSITAGMKKLFIECILKTPNRRKWDILCDEGVRVLRDVTNNDVETLGSNNYVALTTFHVQAAPDSVFKYLSEHNFNLQWPSLLEEPEELLRLSTGEDMNDITLQKKVVSSNDFPEYHEYVLQETSRDEFCHFIISSPMTREAISTALFYGKWRYDYFKPSGFAIMSDRSVGRESDASIVTIGIHRELDTLEVGPAIEGMSNIIRGIITEINEAMTSGRGASS